MDLYATVLTAFVLLSRPLASAASWADIDLAAANLQNQALQYQWPQGKPSHPTSMSSLQSQFGGMDSMSTLPDLSAELPSAPKQFRQTASHQSLSQVSVLAEQLQLASERLAVQQRLAALQLQQAKMLDDLRLPQSPSAVALPQTGETRTELQRHQNPAMAAVLIEPAMYGYYLLLWLGFMIVTGISSALCMWIGKLPFRHCGYQEPPIDSETGRLQQPPVSRQRAASGRSTFFRYPGSSTNYAAALDRSSHASHSLKKLDEEPDEEPDGVETWIRVPARVTSQDQAPCTRSRQEWPGYVDESDGENEPCIKPQRGRQCPRRYLNEY